MFIHVSIRSLFFYIIYFYYTAEIKASLPFELGINAKMPESNRIVEELKASLTELTVFSVEFEVKINHIS